jgi:thiamine biosynthesis protein ThiI
MGRESESQLALLRFSGDIGTKARPTRSQFVARMIHNLRDALTSEGVPPRLQISHNRVFAELPPGVGVGPLTRVFGVQSVSLVEPRPGGSVEDCVCAGAELFRERVRGRRFAVRARRVGDRARIPVQAREVERALGAALLPTAAGVDLGNPEVTVHIELTEGEAYFFLESIPGHGGLPVGVEGRALALISGGFDSAVAAWQMLKRGVSLDYVFCNLGGATHRQGALRVAKVLADRWSYGDHPRLHSVDFEAVAEELRANTRRRYWQVLLKRLMLRAAEQVATQRGAAALVTGEAVGQVSSQTLQNLAAISPATRFTLLRPLVGFNKEEIIALARRIGTYELSKVVREYCSLVPRKPATRATLEAVEEEEARLDLGVVDRATHVREVFDLRELDPAELDPPELQTERIPEGATLIDLRSRADYREWHWPGALWLDFARAVRSYPGFDRGQTYVLYCDFGLVSAHLAELMRKEGFRAFHFKGGTRALKRLC